MDTIIEKAVKNYRLIKNETDTVKGAMGLINPKTRSGGTRISEQELRVLFCAELMKNDIPFSVETPTLEEYSFTGANRLSGNIDACLYGFEGGNYVRKNNIEFKAHNTNYRSDFEKLMGEEGDNAFIHVLPHIDNGTLYRKEVKGRKPVINKYLEEIRAVYSDPKKPKKFRSITFYICILSPFRLIKNIIDKKSEDTPAKIEKKLALKHSVKRGSSLLMGMKKTGKK
ncbi:MAG: hypothetical protein LBQ35_00875 [Spirochaetaceae bacterium]|nr:hypothetical protein [Spirochaetaceae bacterium]